MKDHREPKIKAGEAQALLNNPILTDCLDLMEQHAIDQLLSCHADDVAENRHKANAARELKTELKIMLEGGADRQSRTNPPR